jgi:hypothetical protein
MAKEVLGSAKTLLEAIEDGEVPKPAPMFWDAWQIWRKGPGKRPTRDKCLRANVPVVMRSAKEESQLWGATMGALYGADWKDRQEIKDLMIANAEAAGDASEEDDEEGRSASPPPAPSPASEGPGHSAVGSEEAGAGSPGPRSPATVPRGSSARGSSAGESEESRSSARVERGSSTARNLSRELDRAATRGGELRTILERKP